MPKPANHCSARGPSPGIPAPTAIALFARRNLRQIPERSGFPEPFEGGDSLEVCDPDVSCLGPKPVADATSEMDRLSLSCDGHASREPSQRTIESRLPVFPASLIGLRHRLHCR